MSHSSPETNADISNAEAMTSMPSRFGNAWTALIPIAIGIAIAMLLHFLLPSPQKNYYVKVAQITGIVIVLAVSLNIVNGMTGQFSIGHAGFMTLGGYMSATITYYGSMLLWGSTAKHGGFLGSGEWLFAASALSLRPVFCCKSIAFIFQGRFDASTALSQIPSNIDSMLAEFTNRQNAGR